MGQSFSSGVPAVPPPAGHWQRALGVLVAFAGGVAAADVFQTSGSGSGNLPLILYGVIVLAASLTGGALFRSAWAALAVSGALVLGIVMYVALVNALYDLAHPNAGVGLVVGADVEALAIIVVWAGVPAAALAALASALRRARSPILNRTDEQVQDVPWLVRYSYWRLYLPPGCSLPSLYRDHSRSRS